MITRGYTPSAVILGVRQTWKLDASAFVVQEPHNDLVEVSILAFPGLQSWYSSIEVGRTLAKYVLRSWDLAC